jgi:hypothetical protein
MSKGRRGRRGKKKRPKKRVDCPFCGESVSKKFYVIHVESEHPGHSTDKFWQEENQKDKQ